MRKSIFKQASQLKNQADAARTSVRTTHAVNPDALKVPPKKVQTLKPAQKTTPINSKARVHIPASRQQDKMIKYLPSSKDLLETIDPIEMGVRLIMESIRRTRPWEIGTKSDMNPDLEIKDTFKTLRDHLSNQYGTAMYLGRNFMTEVIQIGVQPTLIRSASFAQTLCLMNPNRVTDDIYIYIGGPGVTTVSGYPLVEGTERWFILGEGVELYGVANQATTLRLLQNG